jgi:hypothetical protein
MYYEWYSQKSNQFNDFYTTRWEILGFKHQPEGTRLETVKIAAHDVSSWLIAR